eukprot:3647368-Prymnesium_polylepis.1
MTEAVHKLGIWSGLFLRFKGWLEREGIRCAKEDKAEALREEAQIRSLTPDQQVEHDLVKLRSAHPRLLLLDRFKLPRTSERPCVGLGERTERRVRLGSVCQVCEAGSGTLASDFVAAVQMQVAKPTTIILKELHVQGRDGVVEVFCECVVLLPIHDILQQRTDVLRLVVRIRRHSRLYTREEAISLLDLEAKKI